jgi:hypothetical protein
MVYTMIYYIKRNVEQIREIEYGERIGPGPN